MNASSGVIGPESDQIAYRYDVLPARGFAYVGDGITALTGYAPAEHYADLELGAKLIHSDDAPFIDELLKSERDLDGPLLLRSLTRGWTADLDRAPHPARSRSARSSHGV